MPRTGHEPGLGFVGPRHHLAASRRGLHRLRPEGVSVAVGCLQLGRCPSESEAGNQYRLEHCILVMAYLPVSKIPRQSLQAAPNFGERKTLDRKSVLRKLSPPKPREYESAVHKVLPKEQKCRFPTVASDGAELGGQ